MAVEDCKLECGGGIVALYPLAGYRDEVDHVHGGRVYVVVIAEDTSRKPI